ncbi:MAG: DinB family protein [Bacteroidota bacterium]
MEKEDIAQLLDTAYCNYIAFIEETEGDFWLFAPEGKWTVGQHTKHLLQSTKPLNLALSLPKFIIVWKYGKTNRALRPYEQVIKRYEERLEESRGKVYKASQNMGVPHVNEKTYLLNRLQVEHRKLEYKTRNLSDQLLDELVLPHPLMGKMPMREIIMWSAHHVDHHLQTLKDYQQQFRRAVQS